MTSPALRGRRIVVPESRELDLFAAMLERHGAETLRCPLVAIEDVADPAPVEAWLKRLAAGAHDDLILMTGEGVTRLLAFAERAGLRDTVLAAMARARKTIRGPKPARALREVGLAPDIAAEPATTDGVIAALSRVDLAGRRVGVQLYPGNPNPKLTDFLAGAGATADPVLCYRYASDAESSRVAEIIAELASGRVDLIAFTSSPQLRRLQDVARDLALEDELHRALRRTRIAAIGPVTADAVRAAGFDVDIEPAASFHLKPLVNAIVAGFTSP